MSFCLVSSRECNCLRAPSAASSPDVKTFCVVVGVKTCWGGNV
jgi:hypothetical protein